MIALNRIKIVAAGYRCLARGAAASFAALLPLAGCRTIIHAPEVAADAPRVYLAHYDRYHTSLVLPGRGVATEYTYGDLDLFARYDQSFWPAIKGMTFPTQGVLGRRTVPWTGGDTEALRRALDNRDNCARISTLRVPREKLEQLRLELDTSYARALSTETYNAQIGIHFVEYAARYTFLHNCNHQLSEWLERLGCRVSGVRALARFELARP